MDLPQHLILQGFLERMGKRQLDHYGLIGTNGYSVPDPARMIPFSFHDVRKGVLKNVKVIGDNDEATNFVLAHEGCNPKSELRIHTSPRTRNCIVVLGESLTLHGDLRMFAANQTAILTGGIPEVGHSGFLSVHIWTNGGILFIGAGSTTNGSSYNIAGDDRCIIVGDDCMFPAGTHLSTHDMHAVVEIGTSTQINHPGDVIIEPHVWLGRNVSVGKGVQIGLGAIVGAHALVIRDCPRFCMVGGVPASVLRTGTTWDRKANLRPDTAERIVALGELVTQVRQPR